MRQLRYRFLAQDLKKQPLATFALSVLVIISALLMSTGAIVMERLVGSVDKLFEEAQPPHFLQMHRGDIDAEALERFASQHPEIDSWLIEEMIGFDGAEISWARDGAATTHRPSGDFSDSLVDHLFVTQNGDFDFLIDESGAIPHPTIGKVYLPVSFQQRYGLQHEDALHVGIGDRGISLSIAGFVHDAQMASSFASSTRFLVSEVDLDKLSDLGGDAEAIIEYRLDDVEGASNFQRAYEASPELPKNGQAVTFQMIRVLNAISGGLVAAALVFGSLLIIVIACINLRFVIRGSLEDDAREIGVLKGIGLDMRAIRGLYLMKYRLVTLVGCAVGGILSPLSAGLLTSHIQTTYGAAMAGPAAAIAPLSALALVSALILMICHGMFRRIGKLDIVRALIHASTVDERTAARHARRQRRRSHKSRLESGRFLPLRVRLSLVELRAERARWALIPLVFALVTVLITLPANLLSTLENPRFVTYMGAPKSDIRSDVQFGTDLPEEHRDLVARMNEDPRLSGVHSYARVPYEFRASHDMDDTEGWESLPTEVGDYADTTIEFMFGTRPHDGEIALSVMVADQHRLHVGDLVELRRDISSENQHSEVRVSGIYQDVTSGGRTAKLHTQSLDLAGTSGADGFVVYANTAPDTDPVHIAAEYSRQVPDATTVPMREYVRQILSYATDSLRGAVLVSFSFGIAIAALITALFLRLFIVRERRNFGTLEALGFSATELAAGVRLKAILSMVTGILLGVATTAALGDTAISAVFAALGLGISHLTLIPNPWSAWLISPLVLCAAGMLATTAFSRQLRRKGKTDWLR